MDSRLPTTIFLKDPDKHLSSNRLITDDPLHDEVDNVISSNDFHSEAIRLESFQHWPCMSMKPEKLAAAGFYYTGESDKVKCFECHVEISQWLPDDDPMVDHQRWSAKCRFIRNIPCGNVAIGVDPTTIPPPVPRGRDVCGPFSMDYCSNASSDANILNMQDTVTFNLDGCSISQNPKHPQFANYDARLRTFETWPISMSQTKEQLASAGFYYTGNSDQTLCYYCGGGLKDWESEDEPWEQHAKWFSKCCYLLTVKGQDYVNHVTGRSSGKQVNIVAIKSLMKISRAIKPSTCKYFRFFKSQSDLLMFFLLPLKRGLCVILFIFLTLRPLGSGYYLLYVIYYV